jgi:IS4 transposase
MHDVNVLDQLPIEPGAFYVMDRGYVDFQRLYRFTLAAAFFVTRSKKNLDCTRRVHRQVDKSTGLRCDQTIVLAGIKSLRLYPAELRRIAFYDTQHKRRLVFLTNNFSLPALTIAQLYKCRWQVEVYQPECTPSALLYQCVA